MVLKDRAHAFGNLVLLCVREHKHFPRPPPSVRGLFFGNLGVRIRTRVVISTEGRDLEVLLDSNISRGAPKQLLPPPVEE